MTIKTLHKVFIHYHYTLPQNLQPLKYLAHFSVIPWPRVVLARWASKDGTKVASEQDTGPTGTLVMICIIFCSRYFFNQALTVNRLITLKKLFSEQNWNIGLLWFLWWSVGPLWTDLWSPTLYFSGWPPRNSAAAFEDLCWFKNTQWSE